MHTPFGCWARPVLGPGVHPARQLGPWLSTSPAISNLGGSRGTPSHPRKGRRWRNRTTDGSRSVDLRVPTSIAVLQDLPGACPEVTPSAAAAHPEPSSPGTPEQRRARRGLARADKPRWSPRPFDRRELAPGRPARGHRAALVPHKLRATRSCTNLIPLLRGHGAFKSPLATVELLCDRLARSSAQGSPWCSLHRR